MSQLESGPVKLVPGSLKQIGLSHPDFAVLNSLKAGRQPKTELWR